MLNRRHFLASGLAAGSFGFAPAYAHRAGAKYALPEKYMPREVAMHSNFGPGEIHVFPEQYALYWTLPYGKAIRYAVGIGRKNLYHSGEFFVGAKKEWPSWTPTPDMIHRQPEKYEQFAGGMPGGISNPLGARALYLFTPERGDTFLRIHGTNDPRTIGVAVSNGCARLVNDQVTEFYERVPIGTKVVLYEKPGDSDVHS